MKKSLSLLRGLNKLDFGVVFILFVLFGLHYKFLGHTLNDAKQLYVNIFTEIIGIYVSVRWINGNIEKNNKKDRFRNYFVKELQAINTYLKTLIPNRDSGRFKEMHKKVFELEKKFDDYEENYFSKDESISIRTILIFLKDLMDVQKIRISLADYYYQIGIDLNSKAFEVNEERKTKVSYLKTKLDELKSGQFTGDDYKNLLNDLKFYINPTEFPSYFNTLLQNFENAHRANNYVNLHWQGSLEAISFANPALISQKIQSSYIGPFQINGEFETGDFQMALEDELNNINSDSYLLLELKELKKKAIRNWQEVIRVRKDFLIKIGRLEDNLNILADNIFEETEKVF